MFRSFPVRRVVNEGDRLRLGAFSFLDLAPGRAMISGAFVGGTVEYGVVGGGRGGDSGMLLFEWSKVIVVVDVKFAL